MGAADADRMLRLVASEVLVELNPQTPSLSAKLPAPWGARLQAAIPPIVDAPVFALRKPAHVVFSLDDYVARGILSPGSATRSPTPCARHDNILIGGGTGSGKTTFANALVKVIAEDTTDRVHIVEDTPELQCDGAQPRAGARAAGGAHLARRHHGGDALSTGSDPRRRGARRLGARAAQGLEHRPSRAASPPSTRTTRARCSIGSASSSRRSCYPAPRALVAQTIQVCVHIQRDRTHPAGRRVSGLDRVLPLGAERRLDSRTHRVTPRRKDLAPCSVAPVSSWPVYPLRWRTRATQLLIVAGLLAHRHGHGAIRQLRPRRPRAAACRGRGRCSSSSPR